MLLLTKATFCDVAAQRKVRFVTLRNLTKCTLYGPKRHFVTLRLTQDAFCDVVAHTSYVCDVATSYVLDVAAHTSYVL